MHLSQHGLLKCLRGTAQLHSDILNATESITLIATPVVYAAQDRTALRHMNGTESNLNSNSHAVYTVPKSYVHMSISQISLCLLLLCCMGKQILEIFTNWKVCDSCTAELGHVNSTYHFISSKQCRTFLVLTAPSWQWSWDCYITDCICFPTFHFCIGVTSPHPLRFVLWYMFWIK